MITTRALKTKHEIDNACALLYEVHNIGKGAWDFSPDNPSMLRVETKKRVKLLVDRFTYSAVWFGAFDGDLLVGCTRLTALDENSKFEVEGYVSSEIIAPYLLVHRNKCFESTRTAVSREYSGRGIVKTLLLAAFKYCERHQHSLMAFVSNSYLKSLLKDIEFPLIVEHAFKYEPQDPSPVNFYFASYDKAEVANMIKHLKLSQKISNLDGNSAIFNALNLAAQLIPIPVYWHDITGVVLGLNEYCINGMGAKTKGDIIGKTPYDFYPYEIAEHILSHHQKVIDSGEILTQDEEIRDITTGETKVFRNIKAPLYNSTGEIIGIIGTAMEVTLEKEAGQTHIKCHLRA
jgi:PAS domain-containing protein